MSGFRLSCEHSDVRAEHAEDGEPGLEGVIEIAPGDRLPFMPQHLFKVFSDVRLTNRFSIDIDLVASVGSYARGNETTCTNRTARTILVRALLISHEAQRERKLAWSLCVSDTRSEFSVFSQAVQRFTTAC